MDAYEAMKRIGEALAADLAAGELSPLSEYQRRFPGHDEAVAREYVIFSNETPTPSVGMDLDLLTTQHRHHYATIREIARGGMGAIYHVRDEALRRDLAMKMVLGGEGKLDSSIAESHGPLARRFLEEAQITAQLDHPGVVPVHELGTDEEGHLFFTMKLVQGRTLSEIFELSRAGDKRWPLNRVLEVLIRALETLAFAHDKGVVHRDLKPANIMVGDFGEVYVMDWGLAKLLGDDEDPSRASLETVRTLTHADADAQLTGVGQVLGTPSYMPLEQARGDELDERVDVYAVGAMIYEHLTGRHPYGEVGKTSPHRDVLLRLLKEDPEPVDKLAPDVPAELVAITQKAMARKAADRYSNAMAFHADLRNFVEGRVVAAHGTGSWIALKKWVGRNRALAASVLAAFVLLVAGLAASVVLTLRADRQWESAQHASHRAALSAAVLAHETGEFARARDVLRTIPSDRRDWVWRLLAARADEPLLRAEGDGARFTPDGHLLTITQRGLEEWSIPRGERRLLLPLEIPGGETLTWLTADNSLILFSTRDREADETRVLAIDAHDGRELSHFVVPHAIFPSVVGNRRYAYRSGDTLCVYDLRTGEELARKTSPDKLFPAAFGLDDELLAVVQRDRGVLLYDAASLTPTSEFQLLNPRIRTAAFCGDGTRLVTAESGDIHGRMFPAEVQVWDVATGRPVFPGGIRVHDRVGGLSVTPDTAWIAVPANRKIHLLDPEAGRIVRTIMGLESMTRALALSPAGDAVAVCDTGGNQVVWALEEPGTLRGHQGFVYPVAYSPDGRRIASGGWDGDFGEPGCIRIWDAETGAPVAAWGEPSWRTIRLAFSPDGSKLLTCTRGRSKQVHLHTWDAETGELLSVSEEPCRGAAFSPDGTMLASVSAHTLTVTNQSTGRTQGVTMDERHFRPSPCFSPTGRHLAVTTLGGPVELLDPVTLEVRATLTGHTGRTNTVAFDAAGRRVITSSHDDTVRVWDVASGREIARLEGVGSEPLCAIFAPDEERVLTGHRDGRIRIWDLDDQKMIAELIGHSEYVYSLARSPDGETVISGSGDCTVRIWGARSPPELRRAFAERAELATELAPRVETLFEELKDPTAIAQCVRREFEGRRLEVALQLVLAESVGRRAP